MGKNRKTPEGKEVSVNTFLRTIDTLIGDGEGVHFNFVNSKSSGAPMELKLFIPYLEGEYDKVIIEKEDSIKPSRDFAPELRGPEDRELYSFLGYFRYKGTETYDYVKVWFFGKKDPLVSKI